MTYPALQNIKTWFIRHLILPVVIMLATGISPAVKAGSSVDSESTGKSVVAMEASVSTMGPGVSFIYRFHRDWALRAGYENIRFTWPFNFEENDIHYDADLRYKSGSVSLLADWHLSRHFFISGGCAYNFFQPGVEGFASRDWNYGDIVIPAADIGEFTIRSSPSLRFSPYLGAGIGHRAGPEKRISFLFEVGTYYQGPPELELSATGLLSPTADPSHKQKEILEKQFRNFYLYPVIKFAVSFVLKKM
jgi:hypothetical protein